MGLPTLATIPNHRDENDPELKQALDDLYTGVALCGKSCKTLLFTSCRPGEGATTISLAYADLLNRVGKKVLYVDANFRTDNNQVTNGEQAHKGLTDYLLENAELEEIIVKEKDSNIDTIDYIGRGIVEMDTAALLDGEASSDFFSKIKKIYDLIIIDSSAIEASTDALLLASHCDAALLIIEVGANKCKDASKMMQKLYTAGDLFIGAVLNKA